LATGIGFVCVDGTCQEPIIPECKEGEVYNPSTKQCEQPWIFYIMIIGVVGAVCAVVLFVLKKGGFV
jgi:hypothetical protein